MTIKNDKSDKQRQINEEIPRERMERIGIYGGTFDPIHIGHLTSAETAYQKCKLDRVLFIPAYNPPHKENKGKTAAERLKMLEIAVEDNPHFEIDRREIDSHVTQYTLDTIIGIQKDYPNAELYYILGEDSILQIDSWYRWEDLLSMVHLAAVTRPDSRRIAEKKQQAPVRSLEDQVDFLRDKGFKVTIIDEFQMDVSSTQLRQFIEEGKSVRYVIPDKVVEYIRRENLYESR